MTKVAAVALACARTLRFESSRAAAADPDRIVASAESIGTFRQDSKEYRWPIATKSSRNFGTTT
ncbi:hypothetical protein I553_4942 [Mycobacterium xenopi 4042]|uniref:Uncharacterized protein n=1 Tax=Mycobacterium xenopi 4042 TaxID=1299334 RepID=X8AIJ8_MYCXE|nr:hypothetical protein I553_4942 [Mycobacterium xenopi 4042]EUA51455.1 hypothetical protein I552_2396 [Mycobacterium xenopi 3993]